MTWNKDELLRVECLMAEVEKQKRMIDSVSDTVVLHKEMIREVYTQLRNLMLATETNGQVQCGHVPKEYVCPKGQYVCALCGVALVELRTWVPAKAQQ